VGRNAGNMKIRAMENENRTGGVCTNAERYTWRVEIIEELSFSINA
jgi:hypothetical protein